MVQRLAWFIAGFVLGAAALYAGLWNFGVLAPYMAKVHAVPTNGEQPRQMPPVPVTQPDAHASQAAPTPAPAPQPPPPPTTQPALATVIPQRSSGPQAPSTGESDRVISQEPTGPMVPPIENLKASEVLDTFKQGRPGGRTHQATDIMEPRDTPVHAMVDGVIKKLFLSKAGGNTIYEFDDAEQFCYYYAHLDHYAEGLQEGQHVTRGTVIGYVGSSGDADPNAPHLHLAINVLGPDKHWWQGTPINPYPILVGILGH